MGYVSSETIDAVIERLNGLHEREVVALQRRLGPVQRELAAFVLAYIHDRGPDVCGFGGAPARRATGARVQPEMCKTFPRKRFRSARRCPSSRPTR
jgi:hypothetical protein